MYSEDDLESAVKSGILTAETAHAFRHHVASSKKAPAADEEYFRLVTGFNDVFVVIAIGLLLVSIEWISASWSRGLGPLAVALAAWGLAEFFTRKRNMALPSIVLLLAFMWGCFGFGVDLSQQMAVGSACAALAAVLHGLRFRVPITAAAGIAMLVAALGLLIIRASDSSVWVNLFLGLSGVLTFTAALYLDSKDTLRKTRKSDTAFWLHMMAAPLLVHPVIASLGLFSGSTHTGQAVSVLGLYGVVTVISLICDRRALMISALVYVLYAFESLLRNYGVVDFHFSLTALLIGSALLLLSAFWNTSRACVLKRLPVNWQLRLPPLQ